MIENLQNFISSLPTVVQWLGVMAAGAIPFVESYVGSALGVISGVPAPVAIVAAIVGNIATMVLLVMGAHAVRSHTSQTEKQPSPKRQRLRRAFDKFGVPGVSLLGQTILPSQITSAAMVSFGAPRKVVIFWQTISIIVWGVAFGVLATLGVDLLSSR